MTLAWIDAQIENTIQGENSSKNVYDLAMLIICREYMEKPILEQKNVPVIAISDYCADLDKVPTIEQVENAISACTTGTKENKQRAKDARTWANIIKSRG